MRVTPRSAPRIIEGRDLPFVAHLVVTQDVERAAFHLRLVELVLGRAPAVDDLLDIESRSAEIEASRLLVAAIAGVALHPRLHPFRAGNFDQARHAKSPVPASVWLLLLRRAMLHGRRAHAVVEGGAPRADQPLRFERPMFFDAVPDVGGPKNVV